MSTPLPSKLDPLTVQTFIEPIDLNSDWMSFRHPDHPFTSASLSAGRFNLDGDTAFYLASGSECARAEVPTYLHKIEVGIEPQVSYSFNLTKFADTFDYEHEFVQPSGDGWIICQELSQILTTQHSVSSIMYQSAKCYEAGFEAYCMAILPGKTDSIPPTFFVAKS